MLTYLSSNKFSVAERKKVLANDYNIKMKEIYEGVDNMSGLGAAIRQKIISKLQKRFSLSKEQAEQYYNQFSK